MNITFTNFGRYNSGHLVTRDGDYAVVFARNPYGRHSAVMLYTAEWPKAVRHGDLPVLLLAKTLFRNKRYRKLRKFLCQRGRQTDVHIS